MMTTATAAGADTEAECPAGAELDTVVVAGAELESVVVNTTSPCQLEAEQRKAADSELVSVQFVLSSCLRVKDLKDIVHM